MLLKIMQPLRQQQAKRFLDMRTALLTRRQRVTHPWRALMSCLLRPLSLIRRLQPLRSLLLVPRLRLSLRLTRRKRGKASLLSRELTATYYVRLLDV